MNQLLNNRVGKKPKSQKRGCLFLILGSLVALILTVAYIVGLSLLTGKVIEGRHGGESAYAVMTLVKGSYGVALLLFYAMLAVWYIAPSEEEVKRQNQRFATMPGGHNHEPAKAMPRRTLWLITGGLFAGIILTGVVALNSYKLVTEDGVRTYFFAETNRYDWEDVSAYSVGCDDNEGLSVTFSFKGGKQIEILHGINSATGKFKERYGTPTRFAAELETRLTDPSDGRPGLSSNTNFSLVSTKAEKFYREAYPELWPYVAQLTKHRDIELSPDETAAETETPVESES